jgi:hypothetical protein
MEVLLIVFGRTFFDLHNFTLFLDFFFLVFPLNSFPFPFISVPFPPAADTCSLLQVQTVGFVGIEAAAHEFGGVDDILEVFGWDFQRFLV